MHVHVSSYVRVYMYETVCACIRMCLHIRWCILINECVCARAHVRACMQACVRAVGGWVGWFSSPPTPNHQPTRACVWMGVDLSVHVHRCARGTQCARVFISQNIFFFFKLQAASGSRSPPKKGKKKQTQSIASWIFSQIRSKVH